MSILGSSVNVGIITEQNRQNMFGIDYHLDDEQTSYDIGRGLPMRWLAAWMLLMLTCSLP